MRKNVPIPPQQVGSSVPSQKPHPQVAAQISDLVAPDNHEPAPILTSAK